MSILGVNPLIYRGFRIIKVFAEEHQFHSLLDRFLSDGESRKYLYNNKL